MEKDKMAETLISEICKIRKEDKIITCCAEDKALCPKKYNKGVFRKECIGL